MHKAQVVWGMGRHKQPLGQRTQGLNLGVIKEVLKCLFRPRAVGQAAPWRESLNPGDALSICCSLPNDGATAVLDRNLGSRDRLSSIERGHPNQRIFAAPFEVD